MWPMGRLFKIRKIWGINSNFALEIKISKKDVDYSHKYMYIYIVCVEIT